MYSPYKETWIELSKLDAETRYTRILADLKAKYDDGETSALLEAVSFCLTCGVAAPEWVISRFGQAWEVRWAYGLSRTLGEAFDIERPKNWHKRRAQKDRMIFIMWRKVVHHHRDNGVPISRDLFELVADELNEELAATRDDALADLHFNGTDVQEAYYATEHLTGKRFREWLVNNDAGRLADWLPVW